MKKIRSYKELYNEILKSFYLGIYCKGEQFPTQLELKDHYHVAVNSVKKVFKMLLDDGFIYTDGAHGTTVLFDMDNPAHMEKPPFFRPSPDSEDFNTLTVPAAMISTIIGDGIRNAAPQQMSEYLCLIDEQIEQLSAGSYDNLLSKNLFTKICKNLDNAFLSEIVEHFTTRVIYADPHYKSNPKTNELLGKRALELYRSMKCAIKSMSYDDISPLVQDFYKSIYHVPGFLIFSVLDKEQTSINSDFLYRQVVHRLLVRIVTGGLKKGDLIPTEKELAEQFGVSLITASKARGVLKDIGLIGGEIFVGTRLTADFQDTKVQEWLAQELLPQKKAILDAVQLEILMSNDICKKAAQTASTKLRTHMRSLLDKQWAEFSTYGTPLFIAESITAPMVMSFEPGIIQKYYFYVYTRLGRFIEESWFHSQTTFTGTQQVYRLASRALDALDEGNIDAFCIFIDAAKKINGKLFHNMWDTQLTSWMEA